MKIIDLFCGIGGLSLGFEQAGFEVCAAIDMWDDAIKTYNANRKDKVAQAISVEEFNEKVLPGLVSNNKITGIIGGPPCQGFSTVGKREIDDARNKLYLEFYKAVKIASPDFFVIENVKGMLTLNNGAFVEDIRKRFGNMAMGLGYNVSSMLMNAADYGVPQNRYRLFFVGIKKGTFSFPEKHSRVWSASEAIGDLVGASDVQYGSEAQNEYQKMLRGDQKRPLNQDYTEHSQQTVDIIKKIPDGGNIKCLPPEYWEVRKYNKAFQRMDSNRPSNTIDTGHRNYFHYLEPRIPTVRESARIQSFPDSFEILGTRGSQYKQVGNAVPPMLAYEIAKQILKAL